MDVLRREDEFLNEQLPTQLTQTRKQLAEVNQKVARLLDTVEAGTAPEDVQERLDLRRSEKQALERTLSELERHESMRHPEPTEAWVLERFQELEAVLREGGPAAALALRGLVGGRIVVRQIKRPASVDTIFRPRSIS